MHPGVVSPTEGGKSRGKGTHSFSSLECHHQAPPSLIVLLHERKEAIKTLQLHDTTAVQDWWSKEKPRILGGDMPEEGARDIAYEAAYEAYYKRPEEDTAHSKDDKDPFRRMSSQETPPLAPGMSR